MCYHMAGWTRAVVAALALYGAVQIMAAAVALAGAATLNGHDMMLSPAAIDAGLGVSGIAQLLALLIAGVPTLIWIHHANANAQGWANDMSVSPGWNVGWFFVPIAGLIKPFEGVRETWQVSHDPAHWPHVPVPALLRWWWGTWLVTNVLGNVSAVMQGQADTAEQLTAALVADAVASAPALVAAVLLIVIVRRLARAQEAVANAGILA